MYILITVFFYVFFLLFAYCIQIVNFFAWHWLLFLVFLCIHWYINSKITQNRLVLDILGAFFMMLLVSLYYQDNSVRIYLFVMFFICLECFSHTYEYEHKH